MPDEVKAATEELLAGLAGLAPEERTRRLGALPDAGVAQELRRLLAYHDAAGADFLEPALPPRIGPYRPIAELGRGGMGVVYLALRADPPLERPVALKLLPRWSGARGAEARALARLEHPNIARFLDAGTAEDGRGYLAMQYIAGIPIDAWCEEQRLSAPERVRLFLKACAAVSYAHQQLVLLCDLKPAHMLVDAAGEPQLLDFGLARLLDREAAAEGGGVLAAYMTPGYASPEQMRGEPLTTASDVYALGAILRRVLGAAGTADLEAIAAKAQAPEAAARYSSVDALAQDLQRYLNFRPPLARAGPWPHRARLLLWRQRMPLLAGGAVAVLLVAGLAGTLWQMRRAQREARLAEQRGMALQQLAAADLLQLDSAIARLPGGTQAREQMVVDSLARLARLAREPGANAATRYDLARGYLKLAQLQGAPYRANLGRTQQALASTLQALTMLQQLQAEPPVQPGLAQQIVQARTLAGQIETRLKRYAEAEATLRQALAEAEAQGRGAPADAAAAEQTAQAALALGDPLVYQQHLRAASRLYAQALALNRAVLARTPANLSALDGLSAAYHRRAGVEYDEANLLQQAFGQSGSAAPLFRRAVADYRRARNLSVVLLEAAPGNEEYQRWNASVDSDLASALAGAGAYVAALDEASKGVNAAAALAAADPANREAEFDLAVAYGTRAEVELPRNHAASEADFQQAEELGERLNRADPTDVENLGRLRSMLEIDETERPRGVERTRLARRALELALGTERLDPHRPQTEAIVADSEAALAANLLASGDAAAAATLLQRARRSVERIAAAAAGPDFWLTAAKVEAAAPTSGPERARAWQFLRDEAQARGSASAQEWNQVSHANWQLGRVAAAVAAAARGLAALPDPVTLPAAQIERGLHRVWGGPGPSLAHR